MRGGCTLCVAPQSEALESCVAMPGLLTWPMASAAASAGAACRAAAAATAPVASCCGRCTALHATRLRVEGLMHVWGVRRPVHCGGKQCCGVSVERQRLAALFQSLENSWSA